MSLGLISLIIGLAPFIIILVVVICRGGKPVVPKLNGELSAARESGFAARARIVDFRRATHQSSADFPIFKLLLEVFPNDSTQESFSTGVVWEVEPEAIDAIRHENVIPVTVNRKNLRCIFPAIPGAHYSVYHQFAGLMIDGDEYEPEKVIAASPQLAPQAPLENNIYRKRSKTVLFGLPLWEVAVNTISRKGRMRYVKSAKARAIVAIGDSATGVVAIGGRAKGLISIGQFSLGLFSFGICSIGLFSGGVFGLGLIGIGMFGVGLLSVGLMSGGYASVGGLVIAQHPYGQFDKTPEMTQLYELLKTMTGMTDLSLANTFAVILLCICAVSLAFFFVSMFGQLAAIHLLEPNDNRLESPSV
jgi:hypothetical protein